MTTQAQGQAGRAAKSMPHKVLREEPGLNAGSNYQVWMTGIPHPKKKRKKSLTRTTSCVNINYIEVSERLRQGLKVAFIFEYLYTAII